MYMQGEQLQGYIQLSEIFDFTELDKLKGL